MLKYQIQRFLNGFYILYNGWFYMLTEDDKELLRHLVDKAIKAFEKEGATVRPEELTFLQGEEGYDNFLKQLLEKLR